MLTLLCDCMGNLPFIQRPIVQRWLLLILSTSVMVFFSEKMYWYIQGYKYLELFIFYIVGVFMLFAVISYFKITDFWPFVLASVIYPLYVEGLFTGIITADTSLFIMLSYFIGWHSFLAVIIGFYFHRKWLKEHNTKLLTVSSALLGVFWGIWSIIYWTAKQKNDVELDDYYQVGQWSISEFAMFAGYISIIYIISHYLLGKLTITRFHPGRVEKVLMGFIVFLFLALQTLTNGPLVIILVFHFLVVLSVLNVYRTRKIDDTSGETVLSKLTGSVQFKYTLIFLLMPALAILVYAFFYYNTPSDAFIDSYIYNGIVYTQMLYGFILYSTALIKTFRWKPTANLDATDNA